MAGKAPQFNRNLRLALAVLVLAALALAWHFNDRIKWFEQKLERIETVDTILHGYHEISRLTLLEINALGESVVLGNAGSPIDWRERAEALRGAISKVRLGIAPEASLNPGAGYERDLQTLAEIEGVVEEILAGSAKIRQALLAGSTVDASSELGRLQSTDAVGRFSGLIDAAIEAQRRDASLAAGDYTATAAYLNYLMPLLMSMLVIGTFLLMFLFSHGLTRSVGALHDGARAFATGNLEHRIPELRAQEFQTLGEAFNKMAQDLSRSRTELREANLKLEKKVEKRTNALKASDWKLSELDVSRRKLVADISHEFRTPLTVIRGESEIALRGSNRTEADYRDSIQRILEQVDQTTRLIDDLLFIARFDAGAPRLKLKAVAIASTIDSVCRDFAATAEKRGISIELTGRSEKAVVHGDPGRLRQVFTVLMDNALRYSNPDGTVEVQLARTDDEVKIYFRDHGIGLTEKEADQAFERFFRGSNAQEHARGTGLGLPVAKAIVNAHKGRIFLQGKPGEGATATVILPLDKRLGGTA